MTDPWGPWTVRFDAPVPSADRRWIENLLAQQAADVFVYWEMELAWSFDGRKCQMSLRPVPVVTSATPLKITAMRWEET